MYSETVEKLGTGDNPSHVRNCDETGLQDIFIPKKVVGERSSSSYQITSGEKGETTTVLARLVIKSPTQILTSKEHGEFLKE